MQKMRRIGKVNIPILGLGTWQLFGKQCVNTILRAVEIGYRHFDTASMYGNQKEIGTAIHALPVAREELFLTSKVWTSELGTSRTRKAIESALKELKTEYLDLYLIHWPGGDRNKRLKSYETMLSEREKGRIKHVGVSNFSISQLAEIEKKFGGLPAVNQIGMTPFSYDVDLVQFLRENEIVVTAYSPLSKGQILDHPKLLSLARTYGRTPAQIALRWFIDNGIATIPKSSSLERLQSNFSIFDFELAPEDLNI